MKRISSTNTKLGLARETLRRLDAETLAQVAGGTVQYSTVCPPDLTTITGAACGSLNSVVSRKATLCNGAACLPGSLFCVKP